MHHCARLWLVSCFKAFTPVRLNFEERLRLQTSTEQAALLQHCRRQAFHIRTCCLCQSDVSAGCRSSWTIKHSVLTWLLHAACVK